MAESTILWEETLEPGGTWSHILKRGTLLRITDIEGGANVGTLLYNFDCTAERLNIPDTLKAQHTARLTKGQVLYSDMGRILCSIVEDSVGWHDPIGGCSNATNVATKYGASSYQKQRNLFHKNALSSLIVELEKWGLDARDLTANVNLFSRVSVNEDGTLGFVTRNSLPRGLVELRAEMNVLTILNTCPHPLDPNPDYAPKPVRLSLRKANTVAADDVCRLSCPENMRGFTLTERYFL